MSGPGSAGTDASRARRSTVFTRATTSRGLNGLVTLSSAPTDSPTILSISSARAVTSTTYTSDVRRRVRSTSRPSASGSPMSRTMRSGTAGPPTAASTSAPVDASATSNASASR